MGNEVALQSNPIDAFMQRMYDNTLGRRGSSAPVMDHPDGWEVYLSRQRQKLSELLRLPEAQAATEPLAPGLLEQHNCGSYTRERVTFNTGFGLTMTAYVLLPKGPSKPRAAVIALHGHGYGSREIVGLTPDGRDNAEAPTLHRNFAVSLVEKGFVVIAPELLGFGDRRLQEDQEKELKMSSCLHMATSLLQMGQSLAGIRVFEVMRTVDYAMTRPEIEGSRIGCMGMSGGGMIAALSAAVDKRIIATVLSGYACTFADSILSRPHCLDNYVPGMLELGEMPDTLRLIAPRKLFVESGTEDAVFPIDGARKAMDQLKRHYTAMWVPSHFQADIFEGKHEVSGRRAYAWMAEQLL
ncbi:dienelactone hydrolase family protein [Paenibacillus cremeus]|uniref:Dienelactone hydrolase n=1 Tax=Paenibacillus cremeus TaxID=2163881 RepID=A0A559KBD4_9BACL|nr:alpha/beta hydrolase family protein [Paenibacillus cremeus]TVY09440.1 dienelactone hydrolase [Paenibacillus cremeus]